MPTVKNKDLAVEKKDLTGKKRLGDLLLREEPVEKKTSAVMQKRPSHQKKRPRETTVKKKDSTVTKKDPIESSPPNRQKKRLILT